MAQVQFQIMSDLHLETPRTRPSYDEFYVSPRCPHLALLGDIGNVSDHRLFTFLETQLRQFRTVFFLLGNHEFYGATVPAARGAMTSFAQRMDHSRASSPTMGHFVYLDRTRFDVDDTVTVLGCTLFSNVPAEQRLSVGRFVTDFSAIANWTVDDHCAAHAEDLEWLNAQVEEITRAEPARDVVIFTHHSPTLLPGANDPAHRNDLLGVSSGFVTDLSAQVCWTSPRVRIWAFGHTHYNCDLADPETQKRVVTNQKGYHRAEAFKFNPLKIVKKGESPPPQATDIGEQSEVDVQDPTQVNS